AFLGFRRPRVWRRLIDRIRTGDQDVATLVSNGQAKARVAIREVFQSVENSSRISFPGHHRAAETKERAYIKGNFFRFGTEADEDEAEEVEGEDAQTGEEVLEEAESNEEPLVVADEEDDDSDDDEDE